MTKKILIVRSFDKKLTGKLDLFDYWKSAFKINGITNVHATTFDNNISEYKKIGNKVTYHFFKKKPFSVYTKAEHKFLKELNKYDIIIFLYQKNLRSSFLKKIKKIYPNTKLIGIFHDNPFFYFDALKSIPSFDYFFVKDYYVLDELKKLGYTNCHFLSQAFSIDSHKNYEKKELTNKEIKKYYADISFIGSLYPQRQKILENLKGYDLKIWGKSIWDSVDSDSFLLKHHMNELVINREKSLIYSLSKININTHHYQNDINGTSTRTFEICACGGFQLVGYKPILEELYEVGKEIETFKTDKELKEKIDYYLTHDKERNRIALAGHLRALKDHSYNNRVEELLLIIK